ncbi:MAG TPA: glycosyltransferase family 4 protein [Dehalococcoidia bacterium]|nr:glycosyltransferase family 4 protein [Dehalococcoidia bacterium]
MRIGIVAPLVEAVPPALYGGTERVVSNLTEQLVSRGHDVTLFASGDSVTSARLVACAPKSLRLDPEAPDGVTATLFQMREVYRRAAEFDIIHNHADWFAFPFADLVDTPTVTTAHGRLDLPEIAYRYECGKGQPLVSISYDQRRWLPQCHWVGTVHNGIDVDRFWFRERPGDYLVFLGRISPEKGPERAVEIAGRAGMRLVVAAKVDAADREYYETVVGPLFRKSRHVEFIGEVNEDGKDKLLGGAYAYLFPIDWPEPFGLTMVESMATGTPVIAMRRGSVPEVVEDGVTGFVCDSVDEMVEAVERAGSIDRRACRERVERLFSAARMADGYEAVYRRVLAGTCRTVEPLQGATVGAARGDGSLVVY